MVVRPLEPTAAPRASLLQNQTNSGSEAEANRSESNWSERELASDRPGLDGPDREIEPDGAGPGEGHTAPGPETSTEECFVRGRVRTPDGAPVANAQVIVSGRLVVDSAATERMTDAQGAFVLGPLPVGPVTLTVLPPSPYLPVRCRRELSALDPATWEATVHPFTTSAPGSLRGVVRGVNQPDAMVNWHVLAIDERASVRRHRAALDSRGRFLFTGLAPDASYTLRVQPPRVRSHVPFALAQTPHCVPGPEQVELRVPDRRGLGSLTVQFLTDQGEPADVALEMVHDATNQWRVATTDPETGILNVGGLPPGDLLLDAKSSDAPWQRLAMVTIAAANRVDLGTLMLETGGRLTLTLQDMQAGEKPSFELRTAGEKRSLAGDVRHVGNNTFRSNPLRSGDYVLVIRSAGYAPHCRTFTLTGNDDLPMQARRTPGTPCIIRLRWAARDADRLPSVVNLSFTKDRDEDPHGESRFDESVRLRGATGEPPPLEAILSPGSYVVRADAPGWESEARITVTSTQRNFEVLLRPRAVEATTRSHD